MERFQVGERHTVGKGNFESGVAAKILADFADNPAPYLSPEQEKKLAVVGSDLLRKFTDLALDETAEMRWDEHQLTTQADICIHPAYHAALHLRLMVLPELSTDIILKSTGILEDLPQGVTFDDYHIKLKQMLDRLDQIEKGKNGASEFEDFVGEVIKLCFFRVLTNAQPKARNNHGVVIRDWIVSNRAVSGFWEVVRIKYDAVQVTWECKNYEVLSADDFQQVAYYLNTVSGRFVVVAYRAQEIDSSFYRHIERIAKDKHGMVLLLTEKDLKVFIRQAIKGKVKEDHINEIFDRTLRAIG